MVKKAMRGSGEGCDSLRIRRSCCEVKVEVI